MHYRMIGALILLPALLAAAPAIDLVYPPEGASLGAVSRSFIHGSVTPGSRLLVNGLPVEVYRTGAFLAYIPFTPGDFLIRMEASDSTGASLLERKVRVAFPPRGMRPDSLAILKGSLSPQAEVALAAGDRLYVSFRGTPGCKASFWVGRGSGRPMLEQNSAIQTDEKVLAFGDSLPPDTAVVPGYYAGSCRVNGDEGWQVERVYFCLVDRQGNRAIDSTGPLVSRWDSSQEIFGRITDSIAVLKTAPELGYELFMPRGTVLKLSGAEGQYYRVQLSDQKGVWVKRGSMELLPPGRVIPPARLAMVKLKKASRGSSASLLLSRPVVYQFFPGADGRSLKLVLYDVQADMDWVRYDPADGLVRDVRWRQPDSRTLELELALNKPLWGYAASYRGNDLDLSLFAPPAVSAGHPLKGVKIALDPGHSPDYGAVGPLRTLEKDVNWQITQRLGNQLRSQGALVHYTRDGNEGIGIYQRPGRAAGWGAELLVSIHNNASPDGVNPLLNSGYSTYYYQPYSRGLAEAVHRQFQKSLPLNDHGLFYGNLVLCRGTEFPSILVEPAFIIVPREEALLREAAFQEKIAAAIAAGIREFLLKSR